MYLPLYISLFIEREPFNVGGMFSFILQSTLTYTHTYILTVTHGYTNGHRRERWVMRTHIQKEQHNHPSTCKHASYSFIVFALK